LTEVVSWCDRSPYDVIHGINASIESDHNIRSNLAVMRQVWDNEEVVSVVHCMSTAQIILEVIPLRKDLLSQRRGTLWHPCPEYFPT